MITKNKFVQILKKVPFLHRCAQFCYWKTKFIQIQLFGTKVNEEYWGKRHLNKESDWNKDEDWLAGYWNSKSHLHRNLLIQKISKYSPSSILEIGCNCGPNIYLIAKQFPDAIIKGIDINKAAISAGNKLLMQNGITNAQLSFGTADKLDRFANQVFDIVFTDATLIYIGPDKIKQVIKEIVRIASKAIILTEWHFQRKMSNTNSLGIYHFGHWKRDYVNLLRRFVSPEKITLTKIPSELWPDKNWADMGYIIEVTK